MTYDPVKRLRSQIGDDLQEVYSLEALFRLAADKIEQLTTERDVSNELGKALEEDAGQLRAERDRLREALTFYAAPETYQDTFVAEDCECCHRREHPAIEDDNGKVARAALKGESHD